MKTIKTMKISLLLIVGLSTLLTANAAMAKTEQIILTKNIQFGEEAVIFNTTKGQVLINAYALPDKVAKQIKPYKKGQCLEIQSKYGFFKDTGDGIYIQNIRTCLKK